MSEELDSVDELEEVLAPMVDGLSGTVAVLLLVATVFMIFSLGQTINSLQGELFPKSTIIVDNNKILFKDSLNLSLTDIALLKVFFKKQNKNVAIASAFVKSSVERPINKSLVALLKFYNILGMTDVTLALGDENECTEINKTSYYNGCIYWSFK